MIDPNTGVAPFFNVNVEVVIVNGSMASLKVALIILLSATFVARFNGSVLVTVGDAPVANLHT